MTNINISNKENENGFFYNANHKDRNTDKSTLHRDDKQAKKVSIFAGDTNLSQNKVTMKRAQAQKDAMKVILDTFTSEKKIDDDIKSRYQKISDLGNLVKEAQEEVNSIDDRKKGLKVTFGVSEDSEEQKDLELLEKQRASFKLDSNVTLTKEDIERLNQMGPKTDYQKTSLEYNAMKEEWQKKIEESEKVIANEKETIKAIKLERLKTNPMLDAEKKAQEIKDTANKKIVDIVREETVENVDEKMKENEEKVRKAKEKAEEEHKALEEKKNKEADMSLETDILVQIQQSDHDQKQLRSELINLINEQKMLEDDTKGIVVDEKL